MEKIPAAARPRIDLSDPEAFRRNPKLINDVQASDLVLVHKTNKLPDKNGVIHPSVLSHPELPSVTVHFSVNGPVNEHNRGNAWNSCKYAIVVPLEKLDKDTQKRVMTFNPADTYVLGHVKLPEGSVILGKAQDFDGKNGRLGNAQIAVVPQNQSVNDRVYAHIASMGRCPMKINDWTWSPPWNEHSHRGIVNRIADNLGFPHYEPHSESMLSDIEDTVARLHLSQDPDFALRAKPSKILDDYRKGYEDYLEQSLHPSDKETKELREKFGDDARKIQQGHVNAALHRLAEFDRIRPGLEASWKRGLAEARAKKLPSRLEASHYNKMHGKGESW